MHERIYRRTGSKDGGIYYLSLIHISHYRMGQEVYRNLTGKPKQIIEKYKELYDIGLHGPDILFYYKPLFANPVNQVGYAMHDRPGIEFFRQASLVKMCIRDRGMGFSVFAILAGVFEMAARTFAAVLLVPKTGYTGACLANPCAWIAADIFLIPAFIYCCKRLEKSTRKGRTAMSV